MSGFDETEALNVGLWEQLDQLTGAIVEKADRIILGDDAYNHSLEVSAEVRRIEREHLQERMRLIREISERNRRLR